VRRVPALVPQAARGRRSVAASRNALGFVVIRAKLTEGSPAPSKYLAGGLIFPSRPNPREPPSVASEIHASRSERGANAGIDRSTPRCGRSWSPAGRATAFVASGSICRWKDRSFGPELFGDLLPDQFGDVDDELGRCSAGRPYLADAHADDIV